MLVSKNGQDPIGQILHVTEDRTERHFHNKERWLGNGAVVESLTGYTITSGNAAYGAETLLLDSDKTPVITGKRFFDVHRVIFLSISNATTFAFRFIWGTGTVGDAETAGQFSNIITVATGIGANISSSPTELMMPRLAAGTKVWAKCKNATNLATAVILIGLHEYDQ